MLDNCPNVDKLNSTIITCNGNLRRRRWSGILPGTGDCRSQEQSLLSSPHFTTLPHKLLKNLKQPQINVSTRASTASNGKANNQVHIEYSLFLLGYSSICNLLPHQAPFPESSLQHCWQETTRVTLEGTLMLFRLEKAQLVRKVAPAPQFLYL